MSDKRRKFIADWLPALLLLPLYIGALAYGLTLPAEQPCKADATTRQSTQGQS